MRRVLLLITDLEIGGTPTVVRELAVRLREPGHLEVEVACLAKRGPVADQLREAGVVVTALGAGGPADLRIIRGLIRIVRTQRYDTVFSFLVHANAAAACASLFCGGVRFIQSVQTTQPYPRWHWWVQRVAQQFAARVVVPSLSAARVAQDWADVPSGKIAIIPNAVDIPHDRSPREWQAHGRMRIGFLGRLDPIKRVPDLVAAMSQLEDRFTLEIHGAGEDRARIEAAIARHGVGDRVSLRGVTADPVSTIAGMDVLVLPSQAEGFGLVLIEAMALGVPVVATDVPGIRDVVRGGRTGLLVPVGSPEELARAIQRLAEDPGLRQRLVRAAHQDVRQRFSWSRVLAEYRRLLKIDDPEDE